MVNTSGSL